VTIDPAKIDGADHAAAGAVERQHRQSGGDGTPDGRRKEQVRATCKAGIPNGDDAAGKGNLATCGGLGRKYLLAAEFPF
jgi:hypothetical protein